MADDAITRTVWPNYSEWNVSKAGEFRSNVLGKDDFLKILITQLRNQDPMAPMQDRDFIAQMAQFTALEQTMNMANELAKLRQSLGISSDMIGKSITWVELDNSGKMVEKSGVVEAILFRDGQQFALVGDTEVALDQIIRIQAANPRTEEPPTEEPPTDEPPTEEPPTDEPPTEEPPTEEPPTEEPQAVEAP